MRTSRLTPTIGISVAALIALTACGSGSAASDSSTADASAAAVAGTTISVVASTNVYGDIAETIGGDLVDVTSIIADPSADPHSYEASAQTALTLSKADVVIENGGGYDDFVDTMLDAADNPDAVVLNAVDISGKTATGDAELNEHVWYDIPSVALVADAIVEAFSTADPEGAATFEANGAEFASGLETLEQTAADLATTHAGAGVAITEPVPLYLLEAAGLVNKTPGDFAEAIEEETDVPPAALAETLALFTDHEVVALVYNSQVTDPQTEQVLSAAASAGVAVVPVTETLPEGETYLTWMTANLAALSDALAS